MKQCHCSFMLKNVAVWFCTIKLVFQIFIITDITKDKLFLQSCYICVYPESCKSPPSCILFYYLCVFVPFSCLLIGLQQFCWKSKDITYVVYFSFPETANLHIVSAAAFCSPSWFNKTLLFVDSSQGSLSLLIFSWSFS